MDLEIFNFYQKYGWFVVVLIVGLNALFVLSYLIIRKATKKISGGLDQLSQAVCDVDGGKIITHKSILSATCVTDERVKRLMGELSVLKEKMTELRNEIKAFEGKCDVCNQQMSDFCGGSKEAITEIRLMMGEMAHDVQRISDEFANVYRLISERLLNGLR